MHFDTVYDMAKAGVQGWDVLVIPLILVGVGWRYWLKHRTVNEPAPDYLGKREAIGVMVVGWCMLVLFIALTWGQYLYLLAELNHGQAHVAEGDISAFDPGMNPRDPDSFVLNGQTFSYRRTWMSQGFQWLHRDGSPVTDGQHVRVTHIGDHILKFEIGHMDNGPPAS